MDAGDGGCGILPPAVVEGRNGGCGDDAEGDPLDFFVGLHIRNVSFIRC